MESEYYLKADHTLSAYRDWVSKWSRSDLHEKDPELRRRYYEEIQGLESKCDAAEIALNACKFAEPEDESARERLEKALADLREAIERFTKRFDLDQE